MKEEYNRSISFLKELFKLFITSIIPQARYQDKNEAAKCKKESVL